MQKKKRVRGIEEFTFFIKMDTYRLFIVLKSHESQGKMYLKNLAKLRKQKGWSQEKLAVESGVSYNTIIKLERGRIENPKIDTVLKLAKALGVNIDDLVTP